MTWESALEAVVSRTGHERYRALTADDHPDCDAWRARMVEMATGQAPAYPSLARQAGNLARAAGRIAVAAAKGEEIRVPREEFGRRLDLCRGCDQWDAEKQRCIKCGCYTAKKLSLATEACPLDPPRWGKWTPPAPDA